MASIKINGKIMEEKLKRGWTTSRFAERFGVTEEEFLEALQKTFSPKAYSGMVSRLKKNEKKATAKNTVESQEEVSLPTSDDNSSIETEICDNEFSLEALQAQKTNFENSLNEKELKHKSLVEERLSIRKSVSSEEKKLLTLKSQISECRLNIESLILQYEDVYQQMQTVNLEISEIKESIDTLDKKIESISKIMIYVYESGEFEIESSFDIEISDWESIYKEIIHNFENDEFECLTVRQIKTLAKCIAYVKLFESQNISYGIIFENEIIESCFNTLITKI